MEIIVHVTTSDLNSAANEAGWVAAGRLVDVALRKVPGTALSKEILSQNGQLKISLAKSISENSQNN